MGKGKKKGGDQTSEQPKENPPIHMQEQPIQRDSQDQQPGTSQSQPVDKRNKKDWACECGQVNFAKKNECKKCKKPRKIEEVKPQPIQEAQSIPNIQNLNISNVSSGVIESSPDGRVYEGKKGKQCVVEVNYATIKLSKLPKQCFHYDVTFEPDSPKKMLSPALQEFMKKFFPDFVYGFDGRKNVYTAKTLMRNKTVIEQFKETITAHHLDRSKEFKITIKWAADIDMSVLLNYTNPIYQNEEKPSTALQALDIVLRSAFRKNIQSGSAISVGRAIYFAPSHNESKDLGDGMQLWYGLFQSAILGRKSLYLNTDVLHKAFPSPIPVLEVLKALERGSIPKFLNDKQKKKLREYLSMLSVGYRLNCKEPYKTYGFNDFGLEASRATFKYQGKMMTVEKYFETVKNKRLNFPNLPVLWVGSRSKPEGERTYLPLELCEIPPGQSTNKKCTTNCVRSLIKYSATSTVERKNKIRSLLDKISYDADPTIQGFGINIDKNFQKTNGRIIDPPKLMYSGNQLVTPNKGVWRDEGFIEPEKGNIKWCILNCDSYTGTGDLSKLSKNMVMEARKQKIMLNDLQSFELISIDIQRIKQKLLDLKQNGYRLVVVIINDFNNAYARVKQTAELEVGILTQCINSKTMGRMNPTTINNILLKLNAKLNGKNHIIQETSYNNFNSNVSGVMFVGADVTHPSPDQRDIPSVVGVATSYDKVGFKYCCAWRLQNPKEEMINDLENIIVEHLQFYFKENKAYPAKIMYYRDGVSDGQFRAVLDIEYSAIKKALVRIYGIKKPAEVTFIIVQKRHHTRFFPTNPNFSDGKFQNIMPGTVVDKDIVHPFQYQFFLASHAAIQGVTKPTKYCILVNESRINPDDLQAITYDLCHLFTRCNRAVSYPAPTYYAHLVAARGKNYILGEKLDMLNLQREFKNRQISPAIVENAPMFFV